MNALVATDATAWIDRAAWPFAARWFEHEGARMHYVDEGEGPVVVLCHGTPSWGWEWRHVIADLRADHRVLCLDMLGFGLSDKPADADFRPEAQSRRIAAWLDHLGIERAHFVIHDFGGPIGLGAVLLKPARLSGLTVLNTFAWDLAGDSTIRMSSNFFATGLGKWLYTAFNFSAKVMAPSAWGQKQKRTPAIQRHYEGPFPTPESRLSTWTFARELIGSGAFYQRVWDARAQWGGAPTALVWGVADLAFGPKYLATFEAALPAAVVTRLAKAGHFPQEEEPAAVLEALRANLRRDGQAGARKPG